MAFVNDPDSNKLYVTIDDIAPYIDVDVSKLDQNWINGIIIQAMHKVDKLTNMVWNGRRRKARIWADLRRWKGGFLYGEGIPVHLPHSFVKQVTSLKIWKSGGYTEIIGTVPEGRNLGGWWLKDIEGIVFLQFFYIRHGGSEIQLEYIYGRDDLPWTVKRLTLLYVLRDLYRYSKTIEDMPEGVGIGLKGALADIKEEINQLEWSLFTPKPAYVWEDLGEVIV